MSAQRWEPKVQRSSQKKGLGGKVRQRSVQGGGALRCSDRSSGRRGVWEEGGFREGERFDAVMRSSHGRFGPLREGRGNLKTEEKRNERGGKSSGGRRRRQHGDPVKNSWGKKKISPKKKEEMQPRRGPLQEAHYVENPRQERLFRRPRGGEGGGKRVEGRRACEAWPKRPMQSLGSNRWR